MSIYSKIGSIAAITILTACTSSDPGRAPSGPVDGTVAQAFIDSYDASVTGNTINPIVVTEGTASFYGYIKMTNTTVPADTDIIGNVEINANFQDSTLTGSVTELADIDRVDGSTTGTYTSELEIKDGSISGSDITAYLVGTFENDTRSSTTNGLGNATQPMSGDVYENTTGDDPVLGVYIGIDGQKVNHTNAGSDSTYQELYDVIIIAEEE